MRATAAVVALQRHGAGAAGQSLPTRRPAAARGAEVRDLKGSLQGAHGLHLPGRCLPPRCNGTHTCWAAAVQRRRHWRHPAVAGKLAPPHKHNTRTTLRQKPPGQCGCPQPERGNASCWAAAETSQTRWQCTSFEACRPHWTAWRPELLKQRRTNGRPAGGRRLPAQNVACRQFAALWARRTGGQPPPARWRSQGCFRKRNGRTGWRTRPCCGHSQPQCGAWTQTQQTHRRTSGGRGSPPDKQNTPEPPRPRRLRRRCRRFEVRRLHEGMLLVATAPTGHRQPAVPPWTAPPATSSLQSGSAPPKRVQTVA